MNGSCHVRFGINSRHSLELPLDSLISQCGIPRGESLDDPVAAVAASLVDPLDFPPLVESIVPGDHVVLAVDQGVPQSAAVVAGIVQTLVDGRVTAENIEIILAPGHPLANEIKCFLPSELANLIRVTVHDPHDQNQLSYLAATNDGDPIYINRSIVDADVAIPVGCVRPTGTYGNPGVHGGVFPVFADAKTHERFSNPERYHEQRWLDRQRNEASEAAWLLGARFTVQIIPGAAAGLLHILSGDVDSVVDRAGSLSKKAWDCPAPSRAELVVATVEGDADQQTWENLGRALHAATNLVEESGAIVVCCDLKSSPGPALMQIIGAVDLEEAEVAISRNRFGDGLPASQLVSTLRHARVYLWSDLDPATVEELWVAPVNGVKEVYNLCSRSRSFIVLENSQYAVPYLAGQTVKSN